jgi:azurin
MSSLRLNPAVAAVVLASLVVPACDQAPAAADPAAAAPPVELRIASDGEFLAFTPDKLTCPTGAHVRLTFTHAGRRLPHEHNWALARPGTAAAVDRAAQLAGPTARWLPRGDARLLATTEMCAPGATSVTEFTAPAPGDYPFLCTFPGHAAEMHGILRVTP